MTRDRRARMAGAVAAALVVVASGACFIADPPTDLPTPTPRRPSILRATADPPDTKILGTYPDQGFRVEVDVDPSAILEWRLFLDFDPATSANTEIGFNTLAPGFGTDGGHRL